MGDPIIDVDETRPYSPNIRGFYPMSKGMKNMICFCFFLLFFLLYLFYFFVFVVYVCVQENKCTSAHFNVLFISAIFYVYV